MADHETSATREQALEQAKAPARAERAVYRHIPRMRAPNSAMMAAWLVVIE